MCRLRTSASCSGGIPGPHEHETEPHTPQLTTDELLAEIDKEIAKAKLTLAELDEEEQSLERLRRWHRELRLRDVLGAPSAASADQQLKACEAKLDDYTQQVFHAVGGR